MQCMCQRYQEQDHQRKLLSVTTTSAGRVASCWIPLQLAPIDAAARSPTLKQLAMVVLLCPSPNANTVLAFVCVVVPLCMPINAAWRPLP